jgi:type VI protein secretion system component VasK
MNAHANSVATWLSIAVIVVGGSMWVGALGSEVASNKVAAQENSQQTDKLRDTVPPAIAELKSQVATLQRDITEIKRTQEEILRELRKR